MSRRTVRIGVKYDGAIKKNRLTGFEYEGGCEVRLKFHANMLTNDRLRRRVVEKVSFDANEKMKSLVFRCLVASGKFRLITIENEQDVATMVQIMVDIYRVEAREISLDLIVEKSTWEEYDPNLVQERQSDEEAKVSVGSSTLYTINNLDSKNDEEEEPCEEVEENDEDNEKERIFQLDSIEESRWYAQLVRNENAACVQGLMRERRKLQARVTELESELVRTKLAQKAESKEGICSGVEHTAVAVRETHLGKRVRDCPQRELGGRANDESKRRFEELENGLKSIQEKVIDLEARHDAAVRKLSEEKEKELLHKRILELEDEKLALALEIQRLKDGDVTLKKKMEAIQEELKEKQENYDDLEEINQSLIIQERKTNDELQEVRKELIKEIIDEDDEKLNGLKADCCDEVYNAVTRALMEMNEYNPSGRYVVRELWNFKEDRKACLKEVMELLLEHSKRPKRKRA